MPAGRAVEESLAQLEPSFWYNLALSNHLDHLTKGHPTNLTAAIEAYRKASDGDCAPALVNLGYAHDLGMGVPLDPARAAEFYQRAADLGNPVAAYNLGRKYFTGTNGLPSTGQHPRDTCNEPPRMGCLPPSICWGSS